ncbi:helix-turn-helix domain-containing protein [Nakamurella aerolata]|uniref:Helix-turn-helix transcriptional regulator n=1 Tax=Nakamurella aerolata TaxID=1656892 RepID=A0A849A7F0_9ACTN|nr:helix-turn-helix transcriptional regulator [Nakamurella aerolata]
MQVRDLKKLRTLVAIQELSHRDIADAMGWRSHSYVSRLLRGEVRSVQGETALALAKLLGCPVDDLFLTKMDGNVDRSVRASRRSA